MYGDAKFSSQFRKYIALTRGRRHETNMLDELSPWNYHVVPDI